MTAAREIGTRLIVIAGMTTCVAGLMTLFEAERSLDADPRPRALSLRISTMAEAWTGEINFEPPYSALSPSSSDAAITGASTFDPADDYWGLPRTSGVDTVTSYCGSCHSLALVMQQRQSAVGWDTLLDWMIEKQGMSAPDPAARTEIVAYLAREFGSN